VRSPAEQEVLNAFLAIEKASIAHDAQEWGKHVADEFVLYRSGYPPLSKAERIAFIERLKEAERPMTVGELQAVHLSVYGDAAAMIASETVPDNSRPPYQAARIWVRRNGQWLLAISVQTDIQTP
jgi:ketosteroid isomerase-like protein